MKKAMIDYVKNEKRDHYDTPEYAVRPLLEYVDPKWTVWEPTDTTGKSEIASVLKKRGNRVISTSQKDFDFLKDSPDFEFDCVITNPPYTLKDRFIEKCFNYGVRWAMLMPITALEGINRGRLWRLSALNCSCSTAASNSRAGRAGSTLHGSAGGFCPKNFYLPNFLRMKTNMETIYLKERRNASPPPNTLTGF